MVARGGSKMTYFLFSDHDTWHREVAAQTWREALRQARAKFGIGGRLRICHINYESRDYRLDGAGYTFSLRKVST
jgi:hypothetical protein